MRAFISICATAFVLTSLSMTANASVDTCTDDLLSRSRGDQQLYRYLGLTASQTRRLATIQNQVNRRVASLQVQLKRVRYTLSKIRRPMRVNPQWTRLKQREAFLVAQIAREQRLGEARVAAMLTPWQRMRCQATPQPHKAPAPVVTRRAPPSANPYSKAYKGKSSTKAYGKSSKAYGKSNGKAYGRSNGKAYGRGNGKACGKSSSKAHEGKAPAKTSRRAPASHIRAANRS